MEYRNKNRNLVGSQSEQPTIQINKDKIIVGGYQRFVINKNINNMKILNKENKFKKIENILDNLYVNDKKGDKTIIDIGCSSGIVSLISQKLGYNKIVSLDHDVEYLGVLDKINKHLNITNIQTKEYSFGDSLNYSGDVVTMLALIHWIYSCTSNFGSFEKIFKYLNTICDEYLLIEWVDPKDSAIKNFKHIEYNREIIVEEYNQKNFENAIINNFGIILDKIHLDKIYRILYIIKKNKS